MLLAVRGSDETNGPAWHSRMYLNDYTGRVPLPLPRRILAGSTMRSTPDSMGLATPPISSSPALVIVAHVAEAMNVSRQV